MQGSKVSGYFSNALASIFPSLKSLYSSRDIFLMRLSSDLWLSAFRASLTGIPPLPHSWCSFFTNARATFSPPPLRIPFSADDDASAFNDDSDSETGFNVIGLS